MRRVGWQFHVTKRFLASKGAEWHPTLAAERAPKPVIEIPVPVQQRALKRLSKVPNASLPKLLWRLISRVIMWSLTLHSLLKVRAEKWRYPDRFKGDVHKPPIVQCRNTTLDHFPRQTYSQREKLPLASEHWQVRECHAMIALN